MHLIWFWSRNVFYHIKIHTSNSTNQDTLTTKSLIETVFVSCTSGRTMWRWKKQLFYFWSEGELKRKTKVSGPTTGCHNLPNTAVELITEHRNRCLKEEAAWWAHPIFPPQIYKDRADSFPRVNFLREKATSRGSSPTIWACPLSCRRHRPSSAAPSLGCGRRRCRCSWTQPSWRWEPRRIADKRTDTWWLSHHRSLWTQRIGKWNGIAQGFAWMCLFVIKLQVHIFHS